MQDSLISILTKKVLPIAELDDEVLAQKGFNVIATANGRDRGVNDLSSALKRRFNTVVLPPPRAADEEVCIVEARVASIGRALEPPAETPALEEIHASSPCSANCEGVTSDGKTKLKVPSASVSTAEAIPSSRTACRWPRTSATACCAAQTSRPAWSQ